MNNIVIPDGFERHFRQSPFTDPWEPLYSKRTDKAVIVGLRLGQAPHQCPWADLRRADCDARPTTQWVTAARIKWAGHLI
jgi:hypothetical protein